MKSDNYYYDNFGYSVFSKETQAKHEKRGIELEKEQHEEGFQFDFAKEPNLPLYDIINAEEAKVMSSVSWIADQALRAYGEKYSIDARANHAMDETMKDKYMEILLEIVTKHVNK